MWTAKFKKKKKKNKKKKPILFILYDFQNFLNWFFPSFNSKIETWLICEAQAQVLQWITSKSIQSFWALKKSIQSFWALKKSKPNRIQQAQPNTQTHLPKTKTLISGVRYSDTVYNKDPKKKKKICYECRRVRHKGAQCVDSRI